MATRFNLIYGVNMGVTQDTVSSTGPGFSQAKDNPNGDFVATSYSDGLGVIRTVKGDVTGTFDSNEARFILSIGEKEIINVSYDDMPGETREQIAHMHQEANQSGVKAAKVLRVISLACSAAGGAVGDAYATAFLEVLAGILLGVATIISSPGFGTAVLGYVSEGYQGKRSFVNDPRFQRWAYLPPKHHGHIISSGPTYRSGNPRPYYYINTHPGLKASLAERGTDYWPLYTHPLILSLPPMVQFERSFNAFSEWMYNSSKGFARMVRHFEMRITHHGPFATFHANGQPYTSSYVAVLSKGRQFFMPSWGGQSKFAVDWSPFYGPATEEEILSWKTIIQTFFENYTLNTEGWGESDMAVMGALVALIWSESYPSDPNAMSWGLDKFPKPKKASKAGKVILGAGAAASVAVIAKTLANTQ